MKVWSVLVLALFGLSAVAADDKECEVCIKVIDELKTTYNTLLQEKGGKNKLAAAEQALEKMVGKKKADPKDKRLYYFLEPMKKDAARQVTFGKETLKICQSLSKKNPEFCSIRYPLKAAPGTDYSKMRVKELKKILQERGVTCNGCIEKTDYIKRLKETERDEL
ncbi:hypothetical protein THRCLA_03626 [Thraustotheca clavata]|uniref:Mesencephalic astrocyte-derived neurotrophic factor homolog n=1 Tax=Thraustotheca clavata TaxID=74557 RepID=A0A1W0A1F5_9STRA|nr:hypothetical protein THRCLA_03626 [Thraustotheca clavata]